MHRRGGKREKKKEETEDQVMSKKNHLANNHTQIENYYESEKHFVKNSLHTHRLENQTINKK